MGPQEDCGVAVNGSFKESEQVFFKIKMNKEGPIWNIKRGAKFS